MELFAVYAAVSTWGSKLRNSQVVIHTDNEAIVKVWESGSSRDENLMGIVRLLFFSCVDLNLSLRLKHIPGYRNAYADLLSRLQVSRFLTLCRDAPSFPTSPPTQIWDFFSVDS